MKACWITVQKQALDTTCQVALDVDTVAGVMSNINWPKDPNQVALEVSAQPVNPV